VYGNRGCLHDADGRIRRRYAGRRWIACRLRFKDWRRGALLQPGRFTELFFLDEATALAAGHRPCALCRRADYDRFGALWAALHPGERGADAIDAHLHAERVAPGRGQRHHDAALDDLPDGAFVLRDGVPWLVRDGELRRWSPGGYRDRVARLQSDCLPRQSRQKPRGRAAIHYPFLREKESFSAPIIYQISASSIRSIVLAEPPAYAID
ncbi:MAG: hypothetical protein JF605_12895, partial [Burkholderia sp.]|nr:hypothetical protein [Burkholderia sp.]